RRFSKRSQERDKIVHEMEEKLGRKLSNNEVAYAVHRSRTRKRRAVQLAAQKRTGEAFAQLERMGAVVEYSDQELQDAVARAYLKVIQSNKSALLVAPTWAEINSVTNRVRNALKEQRLLDSQEHSFRIFDSFCWTQAQK